MTTVDILYVGGPTAGSRALVTWAPPSATGSGRSPNLSAPGESKRL
ncbi:MULTISPECIES: hypothetical protein [unclassified Streptomyces]|jgi:hypothetical protein